MFPFLMQIRDMQAADGVLAVVERNLDDDESVVLFLEDAGSTVRVSVTSRRGCC